MKKENKIISFDEWKKSATNSQINKKYNLKYSFDIELFQDADSIYSFNYFYPEEITEEEFFKIMFEIFLKTSSECNMIKIKVKEIKKLLNRHFSILYYINDKNPKDFKFICTPAISDSELVLLLSILIDNY